MCDPLCLPVITEFLTSLSALSYDSCGFVVVQVAAASANWIVASTAFKINSVIFGCDKLIGNLGKS